MRESVLQRTARSCAENLPGVTLYVFAPGWEAASVGGKWFMLLTDIPRHSRARHAQALAGRSVVIVKADPDDAVALRAGYADITVGYHMDKRHWVTLAPGDSLDDTLVEQLVVDAYRIVVAALPASCRPVDPESFDASASPRR